jgi:hypothetical protein
MNTPTTSTPYNLPPTLVPPMLEEAIGYFRNARLVAFFWGGGDEVYYTDGHLTTCGDWDAYLEFVHHPLVLPHLHRYNLGSSEEEATHYLLLDREQRLLSVAPVVFAEQLLRQQWGPEPAQTEPLIVTPEELGQLTQELTANRPTPEQITAYWREHRRLFGELQQWLADALKEV